MDYTLNFAPVWQNLDHLLAGLALGLQLALVGIAIGCLIGLATAFALLSPVRALRWLAAGYVTLVRNTPILVLILLLWVPRPRVWLRRRAASELVL